jgi:short subunit dehydrogenase-like uncharacterized protein
MTTARQWMIYGANGYTGELVAREAIRRGHRPVLAARDGAKLEPLTRELDLPSRVFHLDEASKHLHDIAAVVHCAGPFSRTSRPMVRACLDTGTHYLDITGEISVFEAVFRKHDDAVKASVSLIPGAGFDVVPTDCLAAKLARAVPDATELMLAFYARGGEISQGTRRTMIEGLPHGGAVRRDGKIVRVPAAWHSREIPFSIGNRWAVTIPWGDVSTAFRTTAIPNIRVYSAAPRRSIRILRAVRPFLGIFRIGMLRRLVERFAIRRAGADEEQRKRSRTYLWGEARSPRATASMTMETPDGYTFTALSAVRGVERVLAGDVKPGAWTPAVAFGDSFVEEIEGVVVHELRP